MIKFFYFSMLDAFVAWSFLSAVLSFNLCHYKGFTEAVLTSFAWFCLSNKKVKISSYLFLFVALYWVDVCWVAFMACAKKIILIGINYSCAVFWPSFSYRLIKTETGRAILRVISGPRAFKVVLFARLTPIPFGLQNTIFGVRHGFFYIKNFEW